MADSAGSSRDPEFTIVIPSRDRPEQLQRCLDAIARLETPRDCFEVIVVDDGSRDPYECLVARYSERIQVSCLRQEGSGPAQARNAGVAEARGRIAALTDDDCEPAPDWLTRLGEVHARQPNALAGGQTRNTLRDNIYSEASQVLLSYLYDYFGAGEHDAHFFASCNLSANAELYRECGGFDRRFTLAGGEDRDFCDRWKASGRPMVYVREAVVHHTHRLTAGGFLRQHFTYGRGAWHFHEARTDRGLKKVRVRTAPFLAGMLAWPFRQPEVRRPLAVSLLIGTSVAVNALGYYYERFRPRTRTARADL